MIDEDMLLLERIVCTPGVLGGKPRIDKTRLAVTHILEALAAGDTADELVADFPGLSHEDIRAALIYAAMHTQHRAAKMVPLGAEHQPYTSPRQFVLSGYVFSHGQLLLRSDRRSQVPNETRVEILFQDARFVAVPHVMDGIAFKLGSPSMLKAHVDDLGPFELDHGINVYALSGNGWRGFVASGAVFVAEDYADPNTPSSLGGVVKLGNPFGLLD